MIRVLVLALSLVISVASHADEVTTPHRMMSGRTLEIVTNVDTGFLGWILKDRGRQQIGYGDLKDFAFNDSKVEFENPLGWDVKIDVAALKFSNGRRLILFVKNNVVRRGPEIKQAHGIEDARREFDFKNLKREKQIRVMSYEDPKRPAVEKTYIWNGSDFGP